MDWPAVVLAKQSPIPLYFQLAELIRERVRVGELTPGAQLPAEREVAEQAGISRMTARQAITSLVRDGTLVARHGVGTFVAAPKLTYDALHLLGFTEESMRHGDPVLSRVLEQALVMAPGGVAGDLGLAPGQAVVKVVRLRSAGATPILLETSWLPAARAPGLKEADLGAQSLYALLDLRYGLRPRRARQTVEATVADDYESDLFTLPLGAPMLLLTGITYDDDERPIEAFKAVYRGDRLKLSLESRREDAGERLTAPRVSVVLG